MQGQEKAHEHGCRGLRTVGCTQLRIVQVQHSSECTLLVHPCSSCRNSLTSCPPTPCGLMTAVSPLHPQVDACTVSLTTAATVACNAMHSYLPSKQKHRQGWQESRQRNPPGRKAGAGVPGLGGRRYVVEDRNAACHRLCGRRCACMGVMDRDVQVQHVGCREKGRCRLTMQSSGQNCKCWYGAEWGAVNTINTVCHASYKQ